MMAIIPMQAIPEGKIGSEPCRSRRLPPMPGGFIRCMATCGNGVWMEEESFPQRRGLTLSVRKMGRARSCAAAVGSATRTAAGPLAAAPTTALGASATLACVLPWSHKQERGAERPPAREQRAARAEPGRGGFGLAGATGCTTLDSSIIASAYPTPQGDINALRKGAVCRRRRGTACRAPTQR